MKFLKAIFMITFLGLASSCGKQDPMADKSDLIRGATPPRAEKPEYKPVPSELFRVESPSSEIQFIEGVPGEFTFTSRALFQTEDGKSVKTQMEIQNLADFPGALFDQATGKLTWTAPKGFAKEIEPTLIRLKIAVYTVDSAITASAVDESIVVKVAKVLSNPIVTIGNIKNSYKEGERFSFRVTVEDPDSEDVDGKRPILTLVSSSSYNNATGFFSVGPATKVTGTNSTYSFDVSVELVSELTTTMDWFGFGVQATSRFGRTSTVASASFKVETRLHQPTFQKVSELAANAGKKYNLSILVSADTSSQSEVTCQAKTSMNNFPGLATFKCEEISTLVKLCQFDWDIAVSAEGSYSLTLEAKNTYKGTWSELSSSEDFVIQVIGTTTTTSTTKPPPTTTTTKPKRPRP